IGSLSLVSRFSGRGLSSLPMSYLPVNDLPGLFCKRCNRFVPSCPLSLWERAGVRGFEKLTLCIFYRSTQSQQTK
ncbi:MAG: hypothetical protein ABW170_14060, partial [Candidatus Thiodiazotropha sp. L084R]